MTMLIRKTIDRLRAKTFWWNLPWSTNADFQSMTPIQFWQSFVCERTALSTPFQTAILFWNSEEPKPSPVFQISLYCSKLFVGRTSSSELHSCRTTDGLKHPDSPEPIERMIKGFLLPCARWCHASSSQNNFSNAKASKHEEATTTTCQEDLIISN